MFATSPSLGCKSKRPINIGLSLNLGSFAIVLQQAISLKTDIDIAWHSDTENFLLGFIALYEIKSVSAGVSDSMIR